MGRDDPTLLGIHAVDGGEDGHLVALSIEYAGEGITRSSRVPANMARKIAAQLLDVADEVDDANGVGESAAADYCSKCGGPCTYRDGDHG